jgi:hypothetical protein
MIKLNKDRKNKMVVETDTKEIFKQIKKQNGEKFAQVIRGDRHHDGGLFDVPNIVRILEFAGHDENDAKLLYPIIKEMYKTTEKNEYHSDKKPLELLSEAGYDAFVVKTEKQKNSIRKYFRPNEELCTFSDPDRHKDYYIIHAIKRGADKIKPSRHPARQDEYGTSVISIQILKTGGFISIKNRYNHTIDNPDATFNNNPDNIIPGLSDSLKRYFNVDFTTTENPLPNHFRIIGTQFVHFNYEFDNVYYDATHYAKGSEITALNPDYEIMLDNVILNKKTGIVRSVYNGTEDLSSIFNSEISGHKIKTETDKTTGETVIKIIDKNKNIKELARTRNGCITSLHLYKTSEIGSNFLCGNTVLETLYAPKLKKMGAHSFFTCYNLKNLYIPELEEMETDCFSHSYELTELNAPKLKIMKQMCFSRNGKMKNLYIPELEEMGQVCFSVHNKELTEFTAPKLKKIGTSCFRVCHKLKKMYVPELEEMSGSCFTNVQHLHEFIAPKLKKMGPGNFTYGAMIFKKVYVPELEEMKWNCFDSTKIIQDLYAPKLKFERWTPKCITRVTKLAKLKDGIKKVLRLSQHDSNGNNAQNFQSPQMEL